MNKTQQKQYHPPKLGVYGTLTQITQSGSVVQSAEQSGKRKV